MVIENIKRGARKLYETATFQNYSGLEGVGADNLSDSAREALGDRARSNGGGEVRIVPEHQKRELALEVKRRLKRLMELRVSHNMGLEESAVSGAEEWSAIQENLERATPDELRRLSGSIELCIELSQKIHALENDVENPDIKRHEHTYNAVTHNIQNHGKVQRVTGTPGIISSLKAHKHVLAGDVGAQVDSYARIDDRSGHTYEELVHGFNLPGLKDKQDPVAYLGVLKSVREQAGRELRDNNTNVIDLYRLSKQHDVELKKIWATLESVRDFERKARELAIDRIKQVLDEAESGGEAASLAARQLRRIKKTVQQSGDIESNVSMDAELTNVNEKIQQAMVREIASIVGETVVTNKKKEDNGFAKLSQRLRTGVLFSPAFKSPAEGAAFAYAVLDKIKSANILVSENGRDVNVWDVSGRTADLNRLMSLCESMAKKGDAGAINQYESSISAQDVKSALEQIVHPSSAPEKDPKKELGDGSGESRNKIPERKPEINKNSGAKKDGKEGGDTTTEEYVFTKLTDEGSESIESENVLFGKLQKDVEKWTMSYPGSRQHNELTIDILQQCRRLNSDSVFLKEQLSGLSIGNLSSIRDGLRLIESKVKNEKYDKLLSQKENRKLFTSAEQFLKILDGVIADKSASMADKIEEKVATSESSESESPEVSIGSSKTPAPPPAPAWNEELHARNLEIAKESKPREAVVALRGLMQIAQVSNEMASKEKLREDEQATLGYLARYSREFSDALSGMEKLGQQEKIESLFKDIDSYELAGLVYDLENLNMRDNTGVLRSSRSDIGRAIGFIEQYAHDKVLDKRVRSVVDISKSLKRTLNGATGYVSEDGLVKKADGYQGGQPEENRKFKKDVKMFGGMPEEWTLLKLSEGLKMSKENFGDESAIAMWRSLENIPRTEMFDLASRIDSLSELSGLVVDGKEVVFAESDTRFLKLEMAKALIRNELLEKPAGFNDEQNIEKCRALKATIDFAFESQVLDRPKSYVFLTLLEKSGVSKERVSSWVEKLEEVRFRANSVGDKEVVGRVIEFLKRKDEAELVETVKAAAAKAKGAVSGFVTKFRRNKSANSLEVKTDSADNGQQGESEAVEDATPAVLRKSSESEAQIVCRRCGERNAGSASVCKKCRVPLNSKPSSPALVTTHRNSENGNGKRRYADHPLAREFTEKAAEAKGPVLEVAKHLAEVERKAKGSAPGMAVRVGKKILDWVDRTKTGDMGEPVEKPLPAQLISLKEDMAKFVNDPRAIFFLRSGALMRGIGVVLKNEAQYREDARVQRIIGKLRSANVLELLQKLHDAKSERLDKFQDPDALELDHQFSEVQDKLREVLAAYE